MLLRGVKKTKQSKKYRILHRKGFYHDHKINANNNIASPDFWITTWDENTSGNTITKSIKDMLPPRYWDKRV